VGGSLQRKVDRGNRGSTPTHVEPHARADEKEPTMNILDSIRHENLRTDHPDFRVGDTLKIQVKVREGNKTRLQMFQGVVIDRKGSGIEACVTVRKLSSGIAVERVFPLHSPNLDSIEVVRHGKVRRARLNYLRGRSGKQSRIAERRIDTKSSAE
jgi:large subunit ribosomal protein L19